MPSMIQAIVTKPYDGAGYDSCKPRVCVGLGIHCWDGHLPGSTEAAKIDYARKFFSTGGQRQYDALVDFVITKDGTIGMLNDPFGTRRPWANGWGDEGPGLEGDGVAFVDKFGAYGTNFNLASCEHEAICGEELTPAQFEASAQLNAWIFDHAQVGWDSFPVNQNYGVVTSIWHSEFAKKDCPCQAIRDQTPALHARIVEILKHYQTQPTLPAPGYFPKPDGYDHSDFKAFVRRVKVLRGGGAECYQKASRNTPKTHENFAKGTVVPVIYAVKDNAGSRWYVHEQGHRMPMSHFVEQVTFNFWSK
jgi:hypothetical protein